MRKVIAMVAWGLALAACGPSKPPEDASSATSNDTKDDGTGNVKWEGASTDDLQTRKAGPPAGSQPSTPTIKENRHDTYDKEATEVVLKRAARQVKANCGYAKDESGKASGPWGKTSVSVQLGHNGHDRSASVPPPFDGKPTGKCAVQAFSNLTFPPWAGEDTTVEWEVEIVEPGKDGK